MYDAIVYDGMPDALDRLRAAGCRLFVATSKPHYYARPILEHFDLARHFAGIHGPELDGTNDHKYRPHRPYHRLRGCAARERDHDRRPRVRRDRRARNGIRTVGVTWGYGSVAELEGAGAAALCDAPGALASAALALLRA